MGVGEKVFKVLKRVGEATRKAVDKIKKELAYQNEISKTKRALLERFNLKQLRQIAKEEGLPLSYEDPFTGEKIRYSTKGSIVGLLMKNLRLDDVTYYAQKFKVKYIDLLNYLERRKKEIFGEEAVHVEEKLREAPPMKGLKRHRRKKKDKLFEKIVRILKKFDDTEKLRDEDDLRTRLKNRLIGKLGKKATIIENYSLKKINRKIDLVIEQDNKLVAVELKIAKSGQYLSYLSWEVETVRENLTKNVIALIIDIGKNIDLDYFKKSIEKKGARVIILKGSLRKSKRRKRVAIIKI